MGNSESITSKLMGLLGRRRQMPATIPSRVAVRTSKTILPSDRREHVRLESSFRVQFSSVEKSGAALATNISLGGLFLQVAPYWEPGEVLSLEYCVPGGHENQPIRGTARVVRIVTPQQATRSGQMPGVGLEFQKLWEGGDILQRFLIASLGTPREKLGQATWMNPDALAARQGGVSAKVTKKLDDSWEQWLQQQQSASSRPSRSASQEKEVIRDSSEMQEWMRKNGLT